MWWLYEVLLILGSLAYLPKAVWRRRLPHRGWAMRLGRYPARVDEVLRGRRPVWMHAVSVGEVQAVRPLIRALQARAPEEPLVLSTVTPGGFQMAAEGVGPRGVAVYFPLDLRACVRRALGVLHPRALLLVESELWPTVIREAKARGIPVVLVNGRISARAFRRYRRMKRWVALMLTQVDGFLMQAQEDADRLIQLGAPARLVQVSGNLKWEASLFARPTPSQIEETAGQLHLNGQDVVMTAGSTHRGEERALLESVRVLRSRHPRLRLILAPRHLERVAEVEALVSSMGFTPHRLSQWSPTGKSLDFARDLSSRDPEPVEGPVAPSCPPVGRNPERPRSKIGGVEGPSDRTHWDVGLVDAFGQLPRYYGVATVVFIGGSLIPHGGQNPLEAAGLGKPLVFGPFMHNFAEIAQTLVANQAARQLHDASQLTGALQSLFSDAAATAAMGRRAQRLVERSQGALDRTLAALSAYL
jgi:3-deoxy-D-manno-octulosonic-acid transferase